MPEMLRDAGYTTGIFGKWHLGDQAPYRPDQGFDEVFIHGAGGIGQSYVTVVMHRATSILIHILHNNKFERLKVSVPTSFSEAMNWMNAQKGKKPFFAYITTNAPHGPFIAPDSYKKKFIDAGFGSSTVGFYGMIENIDDNVGRLTEQLAAWGIENDTLLIFMTDNGPSASNSTGPQEGSVDEGGTRVPSFWRWPAPDGTDVDRVANHYDYFHVRSNCRWNPQQADELHGRSLVPLLKDANTEWKTGSAFSTKDVGPKVEQNKLAKMASSLKSTLSTRRTKHAV